MTDSSGRNMLFYALMYNAPIHIVINRGINVLQKDKDGWTCLHAYCYSHEINEEVIQLCLSKHVDINAKSYMGNTALHFALLCPNNTIETIKILIKNGANIHLKNESGYQQYYRYEFYNFLWFCLLKELWVLNQENFHNYAQWFPFEILEEIHKFVTSKK